MDFARASVCRECMVLMRRQPQTTQILRSLRAAAKPQHIRPFISASTFRSRNGPTSRTRQQVNGSPVYMTRRQFATAKRDALSTSARASSKSSTDLVAIHTRIDELADTILKPTDTPIPAEQRTLYVLEQLDSLISSLDPTHTKDPAELAFSQKTADSEGKQTTATEALLGSVNVRRNIGNLTHESLLDAISARAEQVVRHPNVFITPAILKAYVELQARLHAPNSFPDVFDLYATKPIPRPAGSNSQGVEYQSANPDKVSSAIDSAVAQTALNLAIESNHMPLAIDIITTSFCAPAFKRNKILRQAVIPLSGLAIAPLAAYSVSSQLSLLQNSMEPAQATGIAFAGIMTYIAAVGSMGYIAVTTANDQMRRVTWATGVPLWERWIREEERAAVDAVAVHWGFEDVARIGDEEGEEWEGLREFVGRRGMVLDRAELMDGME